MTGPFRLRVPVQVRFCDLDGLGHVNNAVYLSYLEIARVEYWRQVVLPGVPVRFDFVLARVEMDFRAPADLETPVEVGLRMAGFGRTSFTMEYAVTRADTGEVLATARTVQVCLGEDGRPAPVPEALRSRVEAFENAVA